MNTLFKTIMLAVALVGARALAGQPGSVTLSWNPSISTNVGAYKLYAWTNSPDTNCLFSNARQTLTVGNVTNATLNFLVGADYTFAATAVDTNNGVESQFSNFAWLHVAAAPTYLVTVQSSTNLIVWSNKPVFFRLQITQ